MSVKNLKKEGGFAVVIVVIALISTILLFSVVLFPSCATTEGGNSGGSEKLEGNISGTTTTTVNPKVKGTWETNSETIIISDTAVVVTDKSNPSNTTSYEVVSSDGDKIVVKDPADPTKTIDIDYQLTNNDSELSLTIDGTTYDTTKVSGATTTTTIDPKLKGTWETAGETITISDTAVVVTDKSNPSNTTSYEVVSSDGDKIVVKDPADSTKTIDIDYQLTNNDSELSLTIEGTTYDTTKVVNPTTTTSTSSTTSTTSTTTTTTSTTTTTTIAKPSIIYVSTSGNDYSNGIDSTYPVKTITRAIALSKAKNNIIMVARGTYSELINITTTNQITIKGGYNTFWTRINVNDKSTINGADATAINTGRITTGAGSKVILENLDIKGAKYNNLFAYGVVANGDMTVDNCDIVGMESGTITNSAYGIYSYSNNSKLTILSGTVTAAAGTASVSSGRAYGIFNAGTATISGGTITAVAGSASTDYAYGVFNSGSTSKLTILSGTITGVAASASVSSSAYGVFNSGTATISGSTITGAADSASVNDIAHGVLNNGTATINGGTITAAAGGARVSYAYGVWNLLGTATFSGGTIIGAAGSASVSGAYGVFNNSIATISNCQIYVREPTATIARTLSVLYKNGSSAKFYKGTAGPATIQAVKGTDPNLWNTGFVWD